MDAPAGESRFWRRGATSRVGAGTAAAIAGGVLVAAANATPIVAVGRTGVVCGALAAPFFALREVVAAGTRVDGPAASLIAGGFAGYIGALAFIGPHMVTRGAVAVGVGCGVTDVLVNAVDRRRRELVLAMNTGADTGEQRARSLRELAIPSTSVVTELPGQGPVKGGPMPWLRLPSWLKSFQHIDVDEEYQDLIRRREATMGLLEKEQQRIAALLEELEVVKAAGRATQLDAELGEHKDARSPKCART